MCLVKNIFILLLLCGICNAARILGVFPCPSISHQVAFRPLTDELARRGHEVVVITTDPAYPKGKTPENLTEVDVHDVSYKLWTDSVISNEFLTTNNADIITQVRTMMPLLSKIFEVQMQLEEVQQFINNKTNHYDLIIAEAFIRCGSGLSHVFKAPIIYVSSFMGFTYNYNAMGAPTHPRYLYPTLFTQRVHNLNIREKLAELYRHFLYEQLYASVEIEDNKIVKRLFGPDTPSIRELENNVQLLLINAHPIWDLNRPVPPNIIYMGGVHQKPSKELPKELKTYLDSSKNGVIYVSYGTNADPATFPPEKLQILVRTFSKLPYDILWKWNKEELPGRSANIRISKWLPQSDLLRHPKIKLFIMQGGLQSTDEAIIAGVPLIGMPMLGDQWYNNEQIVYNKIGRRVYMENITEEALLSAINTVINDASYRKNIERLRNIMRDQPTKDPVERAVFWIEHVIKYGGSHLRARVANMTWSEYLDVELVAVLALALLTVLIVISFILFKLVHYVKAFLLPNSKIKIS